MSIFFDGLIVSLLLLALVVGWRLTGRIKATQKTLGPLPTNMRTLQLSFQNIVKSIASLEILSDKMHHSFQNNLPHMLNLRDDFDVLIEHGEKLGKRLDELIVQAQGIEERLKETMAQRKYYENRKPYIPPSVPEATMRGSR